MIPTKPIAITAGEPAGIGPNLLIALAQAKKLQGCVIIAAAEIFFERIQQLNIAIPAPRIIDKAHPYDPSIQELQIIDVPCTEKITPGIANPNTAHYTLATIDHAIEGCLKHQFQSMVTCPIDKSVISQGTGKFFSGHTEYIGNKTNGQPVMLLQSPIMRVAVATTHIPIAQVANALSTDAIIKKCTVIHQYLKQYFGLQQAKIALCGLNPHAGENGTMGTEEQEIIIPAIEKLQQQDIQASGPWPADTIFIPNNLKKYDAIVAMYHDQGLSVIKHSHFEETVNITLGLPIIRTSVDHGTAYHLAGNLKDISSSSLLFAIQTAKDIGQHLASTTANEDS